MRFNGLAITLLCLGTLASGCAGLTSQVHPPLALVSPDRPQILTDDGSMTKAGAEWLMTLVRAYYKNCVALSVLRQEPETQCQRGLE